MSAYEMAMKDAASIACMRCAEFAGQRLKSLRGGIYAFYPKVDMENCKFGVGIVDDYEYLVYQDKGFATFVMSSLKGKTVPMIINGQRVFRRASRIGKFRSGRTDYWRRGLDGELIASNEQRRSWVHPGLPPKDFLRDGVEAAARECASDIFNALCEDMERNGMM